jgi:hypothetical protein
VNIFAHPTNLVGAILPGIAPIHVFREQFREQFRHLAAEIGTEIGKFCFDAIENLAIAL